MKQGAANGGGGAAKSEGNVKDMKQVAANGGGGAAKSPEKYLQFVKDYGLGRGHGGQRKHSIKKSVADSERSFPPSLFSVADSTLRLPQQYAQNDVTECVSWGGCHARSIPSLPCTEMMQMCILIDECMLLIRVLSRADRWQHRFSHAGSESADSHHRVAPPIWMLPRLQRPSAVGMQLAKSQKEFQPRARAVLRARDGIFLSNHRAYGAARLSVFLMRLPLSFVTSSGSASRPPPVPQGAFPYTPRLDQGGEQAGKSGGGGIFDGLKHFMCGDGSTGEFHLAPEHDAQDPESRNHSNKCKKYLASLTWRAIPHREG